MTNAEKYKQEIDELVKPKEQAETVLAYDTKTKELTRCIDVVCTDCLFTKTNYTKKEGSDNCTKNCKDWLQSEYEEDSEYKEDTEKTINDEPYEREDIDEEPKIKKLLFVEEGSVDKTELFARLKGHPEIEVIFYRPNSKPPVLVNLEGEE